MSLFQTLKPKPKSSASGCCLLLDVSGSMGERIASGELDEYGFNMPAVNDPRRVDQMFKVVRETPECQGLTMFTFSTDCRILEALPPAGEYFPTRTSTDLAEAFRTVKSHGFYNAILVTDGCPDSESAALTAAQGMKLGIIYIGNPPTPNFLERLAAATEGTFQLADMRNTEQLQIAIQAALPPPDETPKNGGGAISL